MKNYLTIFLIFIGFAGLAQKHYIQCGQILDVESGKLLSQKTLVVADDRISEVLDGYRTIEHGTLMSDATMALMKEYGVYMVPTISAGKEAARNAEKPGYFPPVVAQKAREIGPQIQHTFERAYKSGVPIAFGTDAGVFPHGTNAQEFGYMVEAGMPPGEALKAATITNATLLGMGGELGQLKAGFLADIIAVQGNPLTDISILTEVRFVMKEGTVYKQ